MRAGIGIGVAAALIGLMLTGCAPSGMNSSSLFSTLATDPADACGIIGNSFPPYSGYLVFARSNSPGGGSVEVAQNGSCKITRNTGAAGAAQGASQGTAGK